MDENKEPYPPCYGDSPSLEVIMRAQAGICDVHSSPGFHKLAGVTIPAKCVGRVRVYCYPDAVAGNMWTSECEGAAQYYAESEQYITPIPWEEYEEGGAR